jgi:hypothetical protein
MAEEKNVVDLLSIQALVDFHRFCSFPVRFHLAWYGMLSNLTDVGRRLLELARQGGLPMAVTY